MQPLKPLVFKASGHAQGHPLSLETFEAQSDAPAWWPARLTLGTAPATRAFDGRVHGLDGQSAYITFATLVERRGDRNVYADILRGRKASAAGGPLEAVFVPPNAAAQIKTLIQHAAHGGVSKDVAQTARAEAQRIRETYGEAISLSVDLAFSPESQRSAAVRRADGSPRL